MDIKDKLFRIEDVSSITTLAKSTIWMKVAQGNFPKPLKLTNSIRAWKGADIEGWIDSHSTAPKESKNV